MRAIWWRELRELGVVILLATVFAGGIGVDIASDLYESDHLFQLGATGAAIGLVQGLLDRVRRADGFLLHRPMSALRIHAARTLAGLTGLLTALVGLVAAGAWWTWREAVNAERLRMPRRGLFGESDPLRDLWRYDRLDVDARAVVLGVGFLVLGYAVARFAASRRRIPVALFAAGACGVASWSLIARHETVLGMAIATLACVVVFIALQWVDLVGDRR